MQAYASLFFDIQLFLRIRSSVPTTHLWGLGALIWNFFITYPAAVEVAHTPFFYEHGIRLGLSTVTYQPAFIFIGFGNGNGTLRSIWGIQSGDTWD